MCTYLALFKEIQTLYRAYFFISTTTATDILWFVPLGATTQLNGCVAQTTLLNKEHYRLAKLLLKVGCSRKLDQLKPSSLNYKG